MWFISYNSESRFKINGVYSSYASFKKKKGVGNCLKEKTFHSKNYLVRIPQCIKIKATW